MRMPWIKVCATGGSRRAVAFRKRSSDNILVPGLLPPWASPDGFEALARILQRLQQFRLHSSAATDACPREARSVFSTTTQDGIITSLDVDQALRLRLRHGTRQVNTRAPRLVDGPSSDRASVSLLGQAKGRTVSRFG